MTYQVTHIILIVILEIFSEYKAFYPAAPAACMVTTEVLSSISTL